MTPAWFKPPLKKRASKLWIYACGIILGIIVGSSIAIFRVIGKFDLNLNFSKTKSKQNKVCYVDMERPFSSSELENFFLKIFPSNISYGEIRAKGEHRKEYIAIVKGDFKKYEDAVQTSKKLDSIDVKNYLQETPQRWNITIETQGDETELNRLKDVIKSKTGLDIDIYPKNITHITFKLSLGPYKNCNNILDIAESLGLEAKERKK